MPLRVWQDRFWDHLIRNQNDFNRHLDYIHYNPVRHGYVSTPEAWQASSFKVYQQRGHYAPMWGWSLPDALASFSGSHLEGEVGEA
jgi:putative transposase